MCFVLKIKKYINTYYSFVILKLFFYLLINHSRTIIESSCCLSLCYRHAAGDFAFLVLFQITFLSFLFRCILPSCFYSFYGSYQYPREVLVYMTRNRFYKDQVCNSLLC